MRECMASVVIPVAGPARRLGECLDQLARQDFPRMEVVVVCNPAASQLPCLPEGASELRVLRQKRPSSPGHLVNIGMRAARGEVKILLMPNCVPLGTAWVRRMVEPFQQREEVGVAVSGRAREPGVEPPLARRLLDAVLPAGPAEGALGQAGGAFRASMLAEIGYFAEAGPGGPGMARDVTLRALEAGYEVAQCPEAVVTCGAEHEDFSVARAMRRAVECGAWDAALERRDGLRWLNSGLFAAALLSLLLPALGAASLPVGVIFSAVLFVWGAWLLAVPLPVLGWDCPVALLNFAAYVAVILAIRSDWRPDLFGRTVHPAILRQWCWLAATTASYVAIVLAASARAALRALRRPRGPVYAPAVFALAVPWWLLAGFGYLRSRLFGPAEAA